MQKYQTASQNADLGSDLRGNSPRGSARVRRTTRRVFSSIFIGEILPPTYSASMVFEKVTNLVIDMKWSL